MKVSSLLALGGLLFVAATANAAITIIENFDGRAVGGYPMMFQNPSYSGSTSGFLLTSPNSSLVSDEQAASGPNSYAVKFAFKDDTATNNWIRLTTYNTSTTAANLALPWNTVLDASQYFAFRMLVLPIDPQVPVDPVGVALSIREMAVPADAAIGSNGRIYTTVGGGLEFVGATGTVTGSAPTPTHWVTPGVWTDVVFDMMAEPAVAFAGAANGILEPKNGSMVVLDALALRGTPGEAGAAPKQYAVYLDDFRQGVGNEIPEPATLSLLGLGLLPVLRRRR